MKPLLFALGASLLLTGCTHHSASRAERKAKMETLAVYVGTYTSKNSQGIYSYRLDLGTGALSLYGLAAETVNPSFLAIHPNQKFLYAVSEIGDAGAKSGGVSAFARDPHSGRLLLLNQQSSEGRGPCHLVVDRAGKYVFVANYSSGSAAVLPIQADGSLGKASSIVQHKGSGPNKQRQERAHAHSINLDPGNRFAFVADLGIDKVMIYRFDASTGKLQTNDPPAAIVAGGAGPRHFAFHPSGKFAYVINELANTITAFAYDAARGALTELHTVPTLPADFKGSNTTAEVVVHPSGKFLYGSNRGHDSIALFAIDASGKLSPLGHESTRGKTPRNFAIEPSGKYLLVANQNSDSIVVFRILPQTGKLEMVGEPVEAPAPVCIRFAPL